MLTVPAARKREGIMNDKPAVGSVRFGDLNRVDPIGVYFSAGRGTSIDRAYIAAFLARHRSDVAGRVLEIEEDRYTRLFGDRVTRSDVLDLPLSAIRRRRSPAISRRRRRCRAPRSIASSSRKRCSSSSTRRRPSRISTPRSSRAAFSWRRCRGSAKSIRHGSSTRRSRSRRRRGSSATSSEML